MQPERRPRRRSCIEKIVFPDSRWSVHEMSLDVGEYGAKKIESFVPTRFGLLVVFHGTLSVQCPEADFGVNLERPLLAIRGDRFVHLLDF
jgi:hypothetical protein